MPTVKGPGEQLGISRKFMAEPSSSARLSTFKTLRQRLELNLEFRIFQEHNRSRTILATPLLRDGAPIGVLVIRRSEFSRFRKTD